MAYFSRLSEDEQLVILNAMKATFDFFDRDFHARLGVTQDEMKQLLACWPDIDDLDDDSTSSVAINNSLNDLLHGVGLSDELCQEKIGAPRDEVRRVYAKWASLRGWKRTGVR